MEKNFSGYIFDLDGTIYVGNRLIDGAREVIAQLQSAGKRVLFLTNKTIVSREKYVEKLNGFGINVGLEHILSPTLITIHYLHEHHRGARLYVIGEQLIKDELKAAGFAVARSPAETDVVVISWDRDFHYRHLDFAYQAIKNGAVTIATNPDRTCPVEGGDVPDCGGMIGAIEGTTGKKVDHIIGKPSTLTAKMALKMLKLRQEECVMVGDRIETDILMGKRAGIRTALVLTGITRKEDIEHSPVQPDFVLSSVKELLTIGVNAASR